MGDRENTLNNLRGIIIGLNMEISLVEQDLSRVEVDLFYLDKLQRDLVYNINLLKQDGIISVVPEYKKSVDALKEVRNKIIKFRFLRQDLQKIIDEKLKQFEHYCNQLESDYNNVLPFKKRE